MKKTLIFGHQNPDTDSICSAIAYAHLKQELGKNVEAVRLGEVNNETSYALNYFQQPVPRLIQTASNETSHVILVDHNERQQSVSDIDQVTILEVIDHHRIANFETAAPLYYRAEPVGCTATIIAKLYREHEVDIPPFIAGLLLSAIVSDTLLFQSPTCTVQDENIAIKLANIAGIDVKHYGFNLLKAGADISDKSIQDVLKMDAKTFDINGYHVEIANVNVIDVPLVLEDKKDYLDEMNKMVNEKKLDFMLFTITDILNNESVVVVTGKDQHIFEQAFNVSLVNHEVLLPGVVSRKKQVVPALLEATKKNQ